MREVAGVRPPLLADPCAVVPLPLALDGRRSRADKIEAIADRWQALPDWGGGTNRSYYEQGFGAQWDEQHR